LLSNELSIPFTRSRQRAATAVKTVVHGAMLADLVARSVMKFD